MWRGRRGALNAIACGVLGLGAALALWVVAVRVAVVPGCTAYAAQHEMTYVDYKVYGKKRHSSGACILASANGATHDVAITEATSYLVDLGVGLAFSLEISVPAFILLFAIARTRLAK